MSKDIYYIGYSMLKVLKNILRTPAGSNGPRLLRKTEGSLACLARDDAHTCVSVSSLVHTCPHIRIPMTCDDTRRAITPSQVLQ